MTAQPCNIPLPVRDMIGTSWHLIGRDGSGMARLLWPWLLAWGVARVLIVVATGLPEWFQQRQALQGLLHIGSLAVGMLAMLAIHTALIRWAAVGPQTEATLGRREGWFFLVAMTASLVFFGPTAIALTLFVITGASVASTAWILPLLILPLLPVVPRLVLAAAAAATGEARFDLIGAWHRTHGNGWRLLACGLRCAWPTLVLAAVLLVLFSLIEAPRPLPMALFKLVFGIVAELPMVVVSAVTLGTIHRHLS